MSDDDKTKVLILGGSNLSASELLRITETIEANNDVMLVVDEEQETDDMKNILALPATIAILAPPLEIPEVYTDIKNKEPSWAEMNRGKKSKKERRK